MLWLTHLSVVSVDFITIRIGYDTDIEHRGTKWSDSLTFYSTLDGWLFNSTPAPLEVQCLRADHESWRYLFTSWLLLYVISHLSLFLDVFSRLFSLIMKTWDVTTNYSCCVANVSIILVSFLVRFVRWMLDWGKFWVKSTLDCFQHSALVKWELN